VVKKEKTHFVTKVVCIWISARGQYLKKKNDDGGKILDRIEKPTGCQWFGPFIWVVFQTMTRMMKLGIVPISFLGESPLRFLTLVS